MDTDTNTRSKQLLLEFMDGKISGSGEYDRDTWNALVMNRNRVAKFLGLPRRQFHIPTKERTNHEAT